MAEYDRRPEKGGESLVSGLSQMSSSKRVGSHKVNSDRDNPDENNKDEADSPTVMADLLQYFVK
ncbi:hypothetical protein T4E_11976 [Trichinella pseudospiralis]|uniref:Uncharacterized protein n=1 Tax=Trichinella pseudospiralis TaxID=6337 RepID=A0A0V0Y0D0_TRIPS|nr:hypothetical protein T4E_11976 [Trichinella pseudospiralis]